MKKYILFYMLIILFFNCSNDDDDISFSVGNLFFGDAILVTQDEVDAFSDMGYSGIVGSLLIGNPDELSDIIDISGLNTIDYVSFSIVIQNTNLTSLDGLENINREPEAQILINNNALLININGLRNITGKDISRITISNNSSLTSLQGLNNIETVTIIDIWSNPNLMSISGLNNLESAGVLRLFSNNSLVSLMGLDNLTEITQGLIINNNNSLLSLNGFDNFQTLLNNTFNTAFPSGIQIRSNNILNDFCNIEVVLQNDTSINVDISGNAFNPTVQDIIDGNCSQ